MSTIRFIMVGGFLGAGKTTTLARLGKHYMAQGHKVGIITNDQAQDLVDTHNLRSQGLSVEEVAGACFCCKFNDLMDKVDVLKKAGQNLTRQAVLDQMANLNETDNPFLYPGIVAKNTPQDHYTITQEYLAKYATSANDYQPLSSTIDVRGQIKFP